MEKLIFKNFDTLKGFTDKCGISDSYWRQIRRGNRFPSNNTIAAMSAALKVPAEVVFKEINILQKKNKRLV